jgi:hypothetical protein
MARLNASCVSVRVVLRAQITWQQWRLMLCALACVIRNVARVGRASHKCAAAHGWPCYPVCCLLIVASSPGRCNYSPHNPTRATRNTRTQSHLVVAFYAHKLCCAPHFHREHIKMPNRLTCTLGSGTQVATLDRGEGGSQMKWRMKECTPSSRCGCVRTRARV